MIVRLHTQEIDEAREMMIERLAVYQKHMRRLPERIVIFRDGVAEVSPSTKYSACTELC
jgi:predicted RNA-binding protein with PIN domain